MPKPLKSGWASIVKKDQPAGSSPRSGIASPPALASPTAKSAAGTRQGFAGPAADPANRQNSSESNVSIGSSRSAPPMRTSGSAAPASAAQRAGSASEIPSKGESSAADAIPGGSSPPARTAAVQASPSSPSRAPSRAPTAAAASEPAAQVLNTANSPLVSQASAPVLCSSHAQLRSVTRKRMRQSALASSQPGWIC